MARILVIDDDTQLLKMLGMMLERAGHDPILVSHGREGIDLAIKSPPDAAIVDVMMPDVSGHEVCRQLRANPGTVDVPILILTARAQPVDRSVALESGATDFMVKPVGPQELMAKLDELLSHVGGEERGQVITLLSLRGGVGVTTLAVNLAGALRSLQVPNITLVDLSSNSGHVALHLRLQPKRTWTLLLDKSELAHETVRSLLISHPSGIHLIAAPVTPTHDASLRETQSVAIADTLARRAEFVIVDAPPVLNPMCIGALKAADRVILVMTPEIASIQTTSATLRVLVKLGISGKKVHLVLNHPHSDGWLPKEAAEKGINRKISFSVPYDSQQNRALAQGTPLTLGKPESPLPSTMMSIAAALKKA